MKIAILNSIGYTNRIFSEANINSLREMGELVINNDEKNPDAKRAIELLKDADVAITTWGSPKLEKEILDACPDLKLVLHAAGSVKGVVSPELWEKGIRVSGSAEAIGKGVAETSLGFTITALKGMWSLSADTKNGLWGQNKAIVKELHNVNVGVIGGGFVGRYYIKLMKNFEVNLFLYDPFVSKEDAENLGVQKAELDELMKLADVISIHAPSIPATNKMINKECLQMMKDDAIIINTARGTIIDEAALIEELQKGRLFACLDVTDPEPPLEESPLRKLPNVVLTPHLAGAVNNGLLRIGNYVVGDLKKYLKGEKMQGEVLAEKLSIIA